MKKTIFIVACLMALSGCGLIPVSMSPSGGSDTPPFLKTLTSDESVDAALAWGSILAGAIPGVGVGIAAILASVRKNRLAKRQKNDLTKQMVEQDQRAGTVVRDLVANIEVIKERVEMEFPPEGMKEELLHILHKQAPETKRVVKLVKAEIWGHPRSLPESSSSSPSLPSGS